MESKITVIIPVYNSENFLEAALDSLLSQTFPCWNAVLINDGSTDGSLAVLEKYAQKDKRFSIVSKKNSGYGATANLGFQKSIGKYTAILEPDDFLLPEAYGRLFELAEKHEADVAKGDYYFYWSNGKKIKANALRSSARERLICAENNPQLFSLPLSVWSALYRTEFLKNNAIEFLETPGASFQDNAFSFKVFALAERVVLTDSPVLCYRQDNINSSIHSTQKTYCIFDEFHELDRWFEKHPREHKKFAYEFWLGRYKAYFAHLLKAPPGERRKFLSKFRREFLDADVSETLPKKLFARIPKRLFVLLNSEILFLFYACFQKHFNAFKRWKKRQKKN